MKWTKVDRNFYLPESTDLIQIPRAAAYIPLPRTTPPPLQQQEKQQNPPFVQFGVFVRGRGLHFGRIT